jgi:hypothetical protein
MEIKFDTPVEISGVKVDKLEVREPTVQDIIEMQKRSGTDSEKELFLFADLTQIAPDDLRKMKLRAYRKIQAVVQENFL